MVATVVRPLGISAGSAATLVFIESVFLGSLPTLALVATFVGPFVPLVAGGWSHRRATTLEDAQLVYEPLYKEIVKNGEQIRSAKKWGQLPMFQRQEIDQIRLSARYSLLKSKTPAVEELVKSLDFIFANQGGAHATASRIIGETIRGNPSILRYDGDEIAFRGKTTDGSDVNLASAWITSMLLLDLDPLEHYRQQGFKITSMDITEKSNVVKGSLLLPMEEPKYRFLWENVKKRAKEDEQITTVRSALSGLSSLASEAEKQVLDKIKKSRSSF